MKGATYYRKRLLGYGIGIGLSLLCMPILHAAMHGVKGHANPLALVPAVGIMGLRVLAFLFAVLWIITFVQWNLAGRPKNPF
jgi:hypothetical protein